MDLGVLAGVFAVAGLFALAITPLIRSVARRLDFVDRPDAHRKVHKAPIALGGGLAVLAAISTALALSSLLSQQVHEALLSIGSQSVGIVIAVGVVCIVGIWDDARQIRARHKLLGQIIAAWIATEVGLNFSEVSFAGHTFNLGWLATPVTMFWLVACINAVNLLDGTDGLASVIGLILSTTVACTAVTVGNASVAIVAIALAGALLGFLRYNAPPASIFLGDAGSMSIGLLAGCLTIQSNVKGAAAYTMLAPLAMWVIPLMDIGMAVVRRKLTGRSLSATDRSHLHHFLLDRGLSPRQLLLFIAGLCIFSGIGSWLSVRYSNSWFAILSSVAVIVFLVQRRIFGHVEVQLAGHWLAGLRRHFRKSDATDSAPPWHSQVRMQGVRRWEDLWAFLVGAAEELEVQRLTLDLNLPWLHEGYHASWARPVVGSNDNVVRLAWPLVSGGRSIGTLTIVGAAAKEHVVWLDKLLEFLSELQERLPEVEAVRPTNERTDLLKNTAVVPAK